MVDRTARVLNNSKGFIVITSEKAGDVFVHYSYIRSNRVKSFAEVVTLSFVSKRS